MTETRKKFAMLACLLTIILAILDQNIVSAAAVPIVRDLDPVHGLARLPWLISAYALAATAALPLYGKLCDVYGARRVYLAALATFLAGSALCGLAHDMGQLIAVRAIQGAGGGGLMSGPMGVLARGGGPQKPGGGGGLHRGRRRRRSGSCRCGSSPTGRWGWPCHCSSSSPGRCSARSCT